MLAFFIRIKHFTEGGTFPFSTSSRLDKPITPENDIDDSLNDYDPEKSSARRRNTIIFSVILICIFGAVSVTLGSKISRFFRGEIGIFGQKIYRPEFVVSTSNLQKINFQDVHESLFIDWLLARPQGESPTEIDSLNQTLTNALKYDKNLTQIVSEIKKLLPRLKDRDAFDRLTYLVWAWNDYLRENNIKWMLDYSALQTEENKIDLFLLGYKVDSTITGNVDGKAINVDFLTRSDSLNVKEKFLGITSEEEDRGRVIWNLCEEFARESVWPALVKASGRKGEGSKFIEDHLRDEISSAIPKNLRTQLSTSADAFYKFQKRISTINKRDRCKINFKIEYDSSEIIEGNYDTSNLWSMFYQYETDRCKPVEKKKSKNSSV
jgi:hypothetical protein